MLAGNSRQIVNTVSEEFKVLQQTDDTGQLRKYADDKHVNDRVSARIESVYKKSILYREMKKRATVTDKW